MKNVFLFLALMSMVFAGVSCDNTGEPDSGADSAPLISKVVVTSEYLQEPMNTQHSEPAETYLYAYDDENRLIEIRQDSDAEYCTHVEFSYSADGRTITITESNLVNGEKEVYNEVEVVIDASGYVQSVESEYASMSFNYSDGYLSETSNDYDRTEYIWKDGNLKTEQMYYDADGVDETAMGYDYTYSDVENNLCLGFSMQGESGRFGFMPDKVSEYLSAKGIRSRNLVSKINYRFPYNETDNKAYRDYDYTLDKSGRVTTIVSEGGWEIYDGDDYTKEPSGIKSTIAITYVE